MMGVTLDKEEEISLLGATVMENIRNYVVMQIDALAHGSLTTAHSRHYCMGNWRVDPQNYVREKVRDEKLSFPYASSITYHCAPKAIVECFNWLAVHSGN
jgi:hypothetical protein